MSTSAAGASKPYKPRKYYCSDPVNADCRKGFISSAGLTRHRNAVHKHLKTFCRPQQHQLKTADRNKGEENVEAQGGYYTKHPVLDGGWLYFFKLFQLTYFLMIGMPVDPKDNTFLPENAPPPQISQDKTPWHPFESQSHFELADFIFRQNKMPGEQIDELMHIWASMPKHNGPPPFANNEDVYGTIDAISEGDAPWTSLLMESTEAATLPADDPSVPRWKRATYEVVFRDPQILLDHQLSNPEFKNHIDYSPRLVYGENGQRVWSNLMTGNWAWNQCVSTHIYLHASMLKLIQIE